ncbi:CoxG family protein [Haloarcula sp. GH36]|uniref:CoxG family protein n=1 Tax=Haloarcula montana TaxID=3111776 RepID=UPI002D797747|nr:carbon monoxide dehydrogenase subunit G [Haloarcula sp. GH36]
MMEFSGEFTVDGSPEELWKYFTDPDILLDCAPGCNKMVLESPSHIVAGLSVGVGSVKPSFDVEAIVTECDRPNRLEIQATGEASRNSFDVTAWQELHDNGDGTTTVSWQANAEISGIIASMGERAIGSVADKLVNEFFQDMEAHVNAGTPAESRLQAASSEETEALSEKASEPATESAGADAVGTVVGKAVSMTSGDGPSNGQSFAAGVVLGLLGSGLWRRLRGSDRQPVPTRTPSTGTPRATEQPTPQPAAPEDSSSLLVLGLTAALGAAGAIIWQQSQSADASESVTADPTSAETDESADAVEIDDDQPAPETAEAEPITASDATSENPLDRLESRP